jgi:hypothetical protein
MWMPMKPCERVDLDFVEEILAWEAFSHMAFRFNETSAGSIAALAGR